jgi:hypothetical protein
MAIWSGQVPCGYIGSDSWRPHLRQLLPEPSVRIEDLDQRGGPQPIGENCDADTVRSAFARWKPNGLEAAALMTNSPQDLRRSLLSRCLNVAPRPRQFLPVGAQRRLNA